MFDIAPAQQCVEERVQIDDFLPDHTPVCEPYVFAGVPQNPFDVTVPEINVGSMVFAPSLRIHQRLVQNYRKTDHYDCTMAEQAFLNWQFSTEGAYPPTRLERPWGGFFPKEDEEGRLKVVHEKIWVAKQGWMKKEWERGWIEMLDWYQSEDFAAARSGQALEHEGVTL
jgi:alpha-N-acetylglucosamine transferase